MSFSPEPKIDPKGELSELTSPRIKGFWKEINPIVLYISLARLIGALGFSISMPFLALYLHQELRVSPSLIGGMLTSAGLIGAIASQFGGRLSDRIGRRNLLISLLLLRSVSFMLLAFLVWSHKSFLWFSVFYISSALFGTSIFPVMDAIVGDVTPAKHRESSYSLVRVAANLGWGIGPAIGGILVIGGYWRLFIVTACLVLLSMFIVALKVPETGSPSLNNRPVYRSSPAITEDSRLRLFLLFYLLMGIVRGQLIATLSIFAADHLHLEKTHIGWLFTVNGLMVAIFQMLVTRLTHRWDPLWALLVAGGFYGGGYLLVGWSVNLTMLTVSVVIITVGEMIESPTAAAFVSRLAPPQRLGEYMGAYNMGLHLGWTIGPLLGGILLDWASAPWQPWVILAALAITSGSGFTLFSPFLKSTPSPRLLSNPTSSPRGTSS